MGNIVELTDFDMVVGDRQAAGSVSETRVMIVSGYSQQNMTCRVFLQLRWPARQVAGVRRYVPSTLKQQF